VVNSNNDPVNATVLIQGDGISLIPQAVTSPSVPAQAPSVGAKNPNTDDPALAAPINGTAAMIPANSAMWFKFDYSPTDSNAHPVVTITMVNGAQSGLRFEVYTPGELNQWWDNTPIGRGTTTSVSCDTGEVAGNGGCTSNDLTWSGSFTDGGTYYVRVVNTNDSPASAVLAIR
jgi:hypothetical protein